jgi:GDPmannose 4,6-dehydratase
VAGGALITGITGQDGTYLAQFLLEKGHRVHGLVRGKDDTRREALADLCPDVEFMEGDLLHQDTLVTAIERTLPTEVYNLGAISFVGQGTDQALATGDVVGLGVTRLLEAIRQVNPDIRFLQASSSEMFAGVNTAPQTEMTPFHPLSPYGVAKLYAHHMTASYRERHGMFACSAILYNHESPRRGLAFVTRKITNGAALIKLGRQRTLVLGNLEARRDWGYAGDYVEAMYLMMKSSKPDDFVIATGETHSVGEVCEIAFAHLGLDYRRHVVTDPRFVRPLERTVLQGDAAKARDKLNWQPTVSFADLIVMMVEADLVELTGGRSARPSV